MADKHTSGKGSASRRNTPVSGQLNPDDDVTSELSGLIARAFGDDSGKHRGDPRITSANLAPHVQAEGDDTLEPGTMLSERFEIVELVHSGGMSHVYKAIDRRRHPAHSQQIHVAVKMLRRAVSDRDEYRLLLEKEASKARSLSHPNIIKIFDFDAHEGQFFLVMEWLQGESLKTMLKRTGGEPLSPTFAWAVIEAVAKALQHSHTNGVIHADINPSNIFVTATHDIKLLDFGVARFADDEEESPEDLTAWVTPSYASPEVLSGSSPVVQDDIFSLACVAYRCLAGTHPFDGKLSIVAEREDFEVRPITTLSQEEWSALKRSLAYARAARPESTSAFLIDRAAENASATAGPGPGPWPWALLAAAVVAAVLGIGWWSQSRISPEDDAPAAASEMGVINAPENGAAVQTAPPESVAVVDSLLALARQAVSAEQLILPSNNNARDWYRQALAIETDNPEALAGLRAISDGFVEEARSAIEANDPQAAKAALATAHETDADNPAIATLEELLVTRGDAQLAAARLAAASGNTEQASEALANAEQYAHIETETIESIRVQLTMLDRNAALRDDLAVVDTHVAAGRLLQPVGDNAYEALVPLRDKYGTDPELTAATRRLADRLLMRAALASASANLAEANSLVSAAATLGVLDEEVARVRAAIATAAATNELTPATPGADTAESSGDAAAASTTPLSVDEVAEATDATLAAAEASTGSAAAGGDTSTPTTAAATIEAGADPDSGSTIATAAVATLAATGDMPADLTYDGNESASIDGTAMAAVSATANRGLITESEIPVSGSEPGPPSAGDVGREQQAPAPQRVAVQTGAAGLPASPTAAGSSPVERSAQSTAVQLRNLGLTRYAAPQYPRGAKRRGLSGHVDVAFNITPDGRTEAIEIRDGEPAGVFERSATRAIRQWRFEPREETIRADISLRFEIEQ